MYIIFTEENNRAGIRTHTDIKRPALFGHYRFFIPNRSSLTEKDKKMKQNDAKNGISMVQNGPVIS
jgi:hypothetical protein